MSKVHHNLIQADAMELATTLTNEEFNQIAFTSSYQAGYRQGLMAATTYILKTLNLSMSEYKKLRSDLGLSELE